MLVRYDDKLIPIFRLLWLSELPHVCEEDNCPVRGLYELRLGNGESLFSTRADRDRFIEQTEELGEWDLPDDEGEEESWRGEEE